MRGIAVLMMRIVNALNTGQRVGFSLLGLGRMSNVLAMEGIEQNLDREGNNGHIYNERVCVSLFCSSIYVVTCNLKLTWDFWALVDQLAWIA